MIINDDAYARCDEDQHIHYPAPFKAPEYIIFVYGKKERPENVDDKRYSADKRQKSVEREHLFQMSPVPVELKIHIHRPYEAAHDIRGIKINAAPQIEKTPRLSGPSVKPESNGFNDVGRDKDKDQRQKQFVIITPMLLCKNITDKQADQQGQPECVRNNDRLKIHKSVRFDYLRLLFYST